MGMGLGILDFSSESSSTTRQITTTDIDTDETAVQASDSMVAAGEGSAALAAGAQYTGEGSFFTTDLGAIREAFDFATQAAEQQQTNFETLLLTQEEQNKNVAGLASQALEGSTFATAGVAEQGIEVAKSALGDVATIKSGGRVTDGKKILAIVAIGALVVFMLMRRK